MKLKGSSYFLIIIMAVMLTVIISSSIMEHLEAKLLPLIVGGIVFILAAVALSREVVALGSPEEAVGGETQTMEQETEEPGVRRYLVAGAWVLGFFLAIYLAGFITAIPLFTFSYMKSHGTGWTATVIFTVLTPALIYGIFEVALMVDLYPGILFV